MSEGGPNLDAAAATSDTLRGGGTDLAPGTIVGEYRIERVIGRGGMGAVYAAIQPLIEKKVAVKVLAAQFSAAPELVRRFIDEARAVNRIGHENIIDIFSFGQLPDGRQYFVMEYLDGATLGERLARSDLPPAHMPTVLNQVCDALEAAHAKKIIHRDLKPENIWVGTSARGFPRARLLDFGIAKLLDTGDQMVTDVGVVMGTPHFMSPEQCNGRGVDHRTDIYALGAIMYRMFAGRLPIEGSTFAEILAKQLTETPPPPATFAPIPDALNRLIVRCLEKDPALRPQSAAEVNAALSTIFATELAAASRLAITPAGGLPATGRGARAAPTPKSTRNAAEAAQRLERGTGTGSHAAPRRSPLKLALVVGVVAAGLAALVAARLSMKGAPPIAATTAPAMPAASSPTPAGAAGLPAPGPTRSPAEPLPAAPVATSPASAQSPTPAAPLAAPLRKQSRRASETPGPPANVTTPAERRAEKAEPTPAAPTNSHRRAAETGMVTDNPY